MMLDKECIVKNTIVITGVHNSGTTIIALLCQQLGYTMVEEKDKKFLEDSNITSVMHKTNKEISDAIKEKNKKYKKWGFKMPNITDKMQALQLLMTNCKFIIILRDPVAMASKSAMIDNYENRMEKKEMINMIKFMDKIVSCADKIDDKIFISYEKLLIFPERVISELMEFLQIEKDETKVKKLAKLVKPEHGHPAI